LALARSDGYTYVFLTNSSPWVGSKFPYEVDRMMTKAIQSVEHWPSVNLLNPDHFQLSKPLTFPFPNFNKFGNEKFSGTIREYLLKEESI
jgi:hypothetical protein